jgi:hypothetical protein
MILSLGVPLLIVLAVAESTISLPANGWGRPDFVLVAVLASGLRWGIHPAAFTALLGGAVLEYLSSAPAGSLMAPLLLLGLLSSFPARDWEWRSPLVPVLGAAGGIAYAAFSLGIFHLLAAEVPWSLSLLWQISIVAALDGILLPISLALLAVVDPPRRSSVVLG